MRTMQEPNDAVDLREIGAAMRRGAVWIAAGAVLGLLVGVAVLRVQTPRYEASSTVLLRAQTDAGSSTLSRLSGLLGGLPGAMGGGSMVETEEKILTSRAVVGEVVDSLGLQARVLEPRGTAPLAVFRQVRLSPDVDGGVYRFERRGSGYAVEGPGAEGVATPGAPYRIPGGVLVLRESGLPESFEVLVSDREGAIARVTKGLNPQVSGEIVELTYRTDTPAMAAAVPNAMVARYLQRRKTTDRGVNQHRFEFLTQHTDSIATQLAVAQDALRRQQEQSGVMDPEVVGKSDLERAMAVQSELEAADVEANALQSIIDKGSSGHLSARELAAYPTFLRNSAINSVLTRLLELETERVALLEKRTEQDPDVVALTNSIEHLDGRLVSLSRDYLAGLNRQRSGLQRELGSYQARLGALPKQAEESYRLQREVKRLSETLVALQTQLIEARLGVISEGGEVRQIDTAVTPRRPVSPNPALDVLGGVLGGVFFGVIGAVVAGRRRRQVFEPWEAELATGLPTVLFDPKLPLWLPELGHARTVLLVPAGRSADPCAVGERLVATAAVRGHEAMLADLAQPVSVAPAPRIAVAAPAGRIGAAAGGTVDLVVEGEEVLSLTPASGNGAPGAGARAVLTDLEERFAFVAVVLPGVESQQTVAVLSPERPVVVVAREGKVARDDLQTAVEVFRRMGVGVAGIVLQPAQKRDSRSA